ncbi:hypothetical protein KIMH_02000 [Bombiscardovia apis]|uniref:Uncharacterized protein n=1 Tax=Bombiscardovia apis TaxID=2932182 RepID=A0ABN6SDF7_9BIFI|nr:hypothetical protein [Bombiscardovia apis]BDR54089.1 hypothetical protein KIMH_02000 [Bombiscardovia apis]
MASNRARLNAHRSNHNRKDEKNLTHQQAGAALHHDEPGKGEHEPKSGGENHTEKRTVTLGSESKSESTLQSQNTEKPESKHQADNGQHSVSKQTSEASSTTENERRSEADHADENSNHGEQDSTKSDQTAGASHSQTAHTQQTQQDTHQPQQLQQQSSSNKQDADSSKQGDSVAAQAGSLAGAAVRNVKKNSRHNPLYLGLAVAFATASLGVAFSTFPIILSLPIAGVLLGISVWLMGHVGIINLSDDSQSRRHHKLLRLGTIGSLLATQIVVTDIFLFTRLGSVGPHQSGIVVAWLIATALETLAAGVIIAADLHHRH